MIILIFIGIAFIFSALVLVFRSRKLNVLLSILYILSHIGLSIIAYTKMNMIDSVYFKFDHLSVLLNGLLSILLIPTLYHSKLYLERHINDIRKESFYIAAMIMLSTAISGVYFSEYLVILWICIEITTLLVAFLVFHDRYQTPLEASWTYLFISSIGIAMASMGILFLAAQITDKEGGAFSPEIKIINPDLIIRDSSKN